MTVPILLLLLFLLFVVAVLYSSVGHAGASGYLAVMALFGLQQDLAKPTALGLNILVATIALILFARSHYFSWRVVWPFALGSVPFAYLGSVITISDQTYKLAVGVVLWVAALRMAFGNLRTPRGHTVHPPVLLAIVIGIGIGMLSGMTGTGGGIFLTPLLIVFRWSDPKPAAGVSAAFILVNSLAGLAGQWQNGLVLPPEMPYCLVAAGSGGLIGSYLGATRFGGTLLLRLLAAVLIVAGAKLIFT